MTINWVNATTTTVTPAINYAIVAETMPDGTVRYVPAYTYGQVTTAKYSIQSTEDHQSEGQGRSREMSVQTMEDLAGVPVGGKVYAGDQQFWRVDENWWAVEEGGPGVVRERMLTGYVGKGQVLTAEEREVPVGAVARGINSWCVFLREENDAAIMLRWWRADSAEVQRGRQVALAPRGDTHVETMDWFRANIVEPPPEVAAVLIRGLAERMVAAQKQAEAARLEAATQVADAQEKERVTRRERERETAKTEAFRTQLREFIGV